MAHLPPQLERTRSTAHSCLSSRAHSIPARSSLLSDADVASAANSTVSARLSFLVSSRSRERRLGLASPLEIICRRSYDGHRSSVNVRYWRVAILYRRRHPRSQSHHQPLQSSTRGFLICFSFPQMGFSTIRFDWADFGLRIEWVFFPDILNCGNITGKANYLLF